MASKPKTQGFSERTKRLLKRGRYAVVFGFAVILFLFCGTQAFLKNKTVEVLESRLHDLRFKWRGPQPPSPKVAIVGITASSFDQAGLAALGKESPVVREMMGNAWPWPRSIHAKVIEQLFQRGARMVAVDIAFVAEREGDEELAAVLDKYRGKVLLATLVQYPKDTIGRSQVVFLPPRDLFAQAAGPENSGVVIVKPEHDGVVRRFDFRTSELRELGIEDDSNNHTAFAVRAVEMFSGHQQPNNYCEVINFAGPKTTYAHIPVEDIFIDRRFNEGGQVYQNGTALRDKLVFYGPIAEILHDIHFTPFGDMPGVEIHAHLAASLLEGKRILDSSPLVSAALAFTAAVGSAAIILWLKNPLWQALGMAGILSSMVGIAYLAFALGGTMIPMAPGLVSATGTGTFGILFLFLLEQWDKAQTRKVLERSVSKRIAKVVLQNAEEFNLARKGARRSVAILFSDIRGFTTWSESAEPEHLVGQLNEYFEKMVDLVESEDLVGNAQKFIGDAILAAWGDTPENQFGESEDARRAVTAALRMRAALKELNLGWAARPDRSVRDIGIGINIGTVIVGEVGHPERGEYTVLGDGANFAARLESATKQFHTDCLVGENVEALTRGKFVYRHADFIRVKGKTKPVNVFFPLSEAGTPPPEWLEDYHRARGLYLDRKFFEAAELFANVKARIGGEDFLCDLYLKQCTHFAQAAPPSDWDGSRELTEK